MSKHTPGPWVWIEPLRVLNSAHGKVIDHAYFEGMWFARHDAEDEANARLIAAAPDLLSVAYAIDDVADRIDHDPDSALGQAAAMARAAIAKATGGEP